MQIIPLDHNQRPQRGNEKRKRGKMFGVREKNTNKKLSQKTSPTLKSGLHLPAKQKMVHRLTKKRRL